MKAKFNYKSKKTIIIAIIVLALIVITGIGVGLYLKGNNDIEALGTNVVVGNNIDNNASENNPSNNQTGSTDNNNAGTADSNENADNATNDGENANNNVNVDNGDNTNNGQNADNNANTDANNNQNQGNANNGNNVTMQEFVTERVEIIPEKVIAENYWVTWEPTKFETLVSGEISLEKANIVAEKTVAKLTANGLEQNPESVKVGEILQYTIKLTNTSSKINGTINVTDEIPAGTEFIAATETNLKTTIEETENGSKVTKLEWKNVKVEAGSEVTLLVYVKVVAKAETKDGDGETVVDTTSVQNTAKIYDITTPEEDVPSPETKVANITSEKTSKVIYNEQKPHEHIVVDGIEPLHEQDIIEYTITLTNVGEAAGTVKVSDTVPEGTTLINGGVVTVVDQNGTTTYEIDELVEGIDVTVAAATEEAAGVATVTFRVIVNSFDTETKQIVNDMAKVDGDSTNETEDEAEKVYINIPVTKVWANIESDAAQVYSVDSIKFQVKNGETVVAEKVVALEADAENGIAGRWTYTFENLPKYDANGNGINYTVVELATNSDEQKILDTYYNADTAITIDLASTNVTITNTFDPSKLTDTTSIQVKKEWINDEGYENHREAITVQLYADNVALNGKTLELNEENNWTNTFTDLEKYKNDGTEIQYKVIETTQVEGYRASYREENGVAIVTNTYIRIQSGTITKNWTESSQTKVEVPLDVVFIVDTSSSMTYPVKDANGNVVKDEQGKTVTRVDEMIPAVNGAIEEILSYNKENRVSVVAYSDYVCAHPDLSIKSYKNTDDANVLLELDNGYTPKTYETYLDGKGEIVKKVGNYLTYDETKQKIVTNVQQLGQSQNSRYFEQATFTQAGIELGAKQLMDPDVTKTVIVNGSEVTRIPVMILVTDGEPTYYTKEYKTPMEANLQDGTISGANSATQNPDMKGKGTLKDVTANFGYYTILTAKYYKNEVNKSYGFSSMQTKMYTIGIGVETQFGKTVLDPGRKTETAYVDKTNGLKDSTETPKLINKLRNSNNELKDESYDYADKAYFGEMNTEELISVMKQILTDSLQKTQTWNITATEINTGKVYLPNVKTSTVTIKQDGTNKFYNTSEIIFYDSNVEKYYLDLTKLTPCTSVSITYAVE